MNYRTNFKSIGYLTNERIEPPQGWPLPEPPPVPELPGSMKFALLYMRRNADELTGKVVEAMREMGAEWSVSDLHQLRALGFMTQPPGMHHVLTDAGEREANKIARDLARKYPVHHITIREAVRGSNMGPWAACSCGHWNAHASRTNRSRLDHRAACHLAEVRNGTWKPFRTSDEVMAEVDALLKSQGANTEKTSAPGDGAVAPTPTAPVNDPDAFDDPDCSIYSDESGDDRNVIDMVEDEAA